MGWGKCLLSTNSFGKATACCAHCCVPPAVCPLAFVCMWCSLLCTSCSVSTLAVCRAHCRVPHALCPLWPYVVLTAVYLMLCVHFGRMAVCCAHCCVPHAVCPLAFVCRVLSLVGMTQINRHYFDTAKTIQVPGRG